MKKWTFLLLIILLMTACQGDDIQSVTVPETGMVTESMAETELLNETELLETEAAETEATEEETEATEEETDVESTSIRMTAVGDIMFHITQLNYSDFGDHYDFTESFEPMRPYIENADIAVGNYETTTNPDYEYSAYPQFNTPAAALDAIKGVGFDVLSTVNNHTLDTYIEGVDTTIDAIRERDLAQFGTRKTPDEPILVKEVNGIKIAFLAYTYGFNGLEYTVSDEDYYNKLSPLKESIFEEEITEARELADLIVVYPHWGIEYSRWPSEEQQYFAHRMVELGAHLVLGSHPHVVQPQEWTEHPDGNEAYIIYSMGNYLSGQRLEHNEDIHVEQSVLLDIAITKDADGIHIDEVNTVPLWVDRTDHGLYQTLPAEDILNNHRDDYADWRLDRMQQAVDDTRSILSETVGE